MHLSLPTLLDDDGAAGLLAELVSCAESRDAVLLDFSTVAFAHPFGALLAAEGLRRFKAHRVARGLPLQCLAKGISTLPQSRACSYLKHVGFFKHAGWDAGNAPGEAAGSSTYLPITRLRSADIARKSGVAGLAEAVKRKCYDLAALVFPGEEARDMLAYCFTEVVRNVFEHSGVSNCVLMAQRYASGVVELAIADGGCGIRASLSTAYPGLTAASALQRAIEPGITCARRFGEFGNDVNAGFGLYVLSELGRQLGQFALWSDNQQLYASAAKQILPRPHIRGTALKLSVRLDDAEYFSNWLAQTVAEGDSALPKDAVRSDGLSKGTSTRMW